jgi:hypothetical protein
VKEHLAIKCSARSIFDTDIFASRWRPLNSTQLSVSVISGKSAFATSTFAGHFTLAVNWVPMLPYFLRSIV